MNSWAAINPKYYGFLLDDQSVVLAFKLDFTNSMTPVVHSDVVLSKIKTGSIFFNQKTLGNFLMKDRQLPGSPLFKIDLVGVDKKQLTRAFASAKIELDWGFLDEYGKVRPLLVSTGGESLKDTEGWSFIKEEQVPANIKTKIELEVLKHRLPQKCTQKESKIKDFPLTAKNLNFGRFYRSADSKKYVVPVDIKKTEDLYLCNGNEMGIASALVIVSEESVTDILQSQDWNYRNLTLLESADLDGDNISELIFADNGYNLAGFSIHNFKTKKLVSFLVSSH